MPADLGFYDLRLPETREAQATLAQAAGIESFCYWHYWFAGQRILERPFNEVLGSGSPDFGFCLGWANESWTGIWHNAPGRILIEQSYPGEDDHRRHFAELIPALTDRRYTRVDGRPLFYVLRPWNLPDMRSMVELWQSMAADAGLPGLHMVAQTNGSGDELLDAGFDGFVSIPAWRRIAARRPLARQVYDRLLRRPRVVHGRHLARALQRANSGSPRQYPCVVPQWDNTPRTGKEGIVIRDATPAMFKRQVAGAVETLANRPVSQRLLFVKSWNEWAEGNHIEPDRHVGHGYLDALRAELTSIAQ